MMVMTTRQHFSNQQLYDQLIPDPFLSSSSSSLSLPPFCHPTPFIYDQEKRLDIYLNSKAHFKVFKRPRLQFFVLSCSLYTQSGSKASLDSLGLPIFIVMRAGIFAQFTS